MKVCVVGSGGREHALARALGRTHTVVVTPGNPGIAGSIDQPPQEIDADLFVIGPEGPLVAGLADELRAQQKLVFGPGADGARIEGSKAWMKDLVAAAEVPTARYGTFRELEPALAYLDTLGDLYVIKTDGLAAGKGVLVTESRAEARDAVAAYLAGDAFGDAGKTVVLEEGLIGPELSLLAICDGNRAIPLPAAQDFKRLGDGDSGPNTGGMGAYSPVPIATDAVIDEVMDRFVEPTLAELRARDIDYRGVLYAGLMITPDGPKLIEYNCRFGDPETQVVLPRLTGDLASFLAAAAAGNIDELPEVSPDAAVTVVSAVDGYPNAPSCGDPIRGIAEAEAVPGVELYMAGVARDGDGRLITAGGRVLACTGLGATVAEARAQAYQATELLDWPGRHFRSDIATT